MKRIFAKGTVVILFALLMTLNVTSTISNTKISFKGKEAQAQIEPIKCFAEWFYCNDPDDPFKFRKICHENGDAPEKCACGTSTEC